MALSIDVVDQVIRAFVVWPVWQRQRVYIRYRGNLLFARKLIYRALCPKCACRPIQ